MPKEWRNGWVVDSKGETTGPSQVSVVANNRALESNGSCRRCTGTGGAGSHREWMSSILYNSLDRSTSERERGRSFIQKIITRTARVSSPGNHSLLCVSRFPIHVLHINESPKEPHPHNESFTPFIPPFLLLLKTKNKFW